MNRSLSGLVGAAVVAPVAAAVALSAPAHAATGGLTEGAARGVVPSVADATALVAGPLKAAGSEVRSPAESGRGTVAETTRQLGLDGVVPDCLPVVEGALGGVSGALSGQDAGALPDGPAAKKRAAKRSGTAKRCASTRPEDALALRKPSVNPVSAIQPGLPATGSLAAPQAGERALRVAPADGGLPVAGDLLGGGGLPVGGDLLGGGGGLPIVGDLLGGGLLGGLPVGGDLLGGAAGGGAAGGAPSGGQPGGAPAGGQAGGGQPSGGGAGGGGAGDAGGGEAGEG